MLKTLATDVMFTKKWRLLTLILSLLLVLITAIALKVCFHHR